MLENENIQLKENSVRFTSKSSQRPTKQNDFKLFCIDLPSYLLVSWILLSQIMIIQPSKSARKQLLYKYLDNICKGDGWSHPPPNPPPSAAQGSVQAPPSTATWTRHFPPTLFPALPSLRSSSSTLSTIICFVCDLLFKRQKSTQQTLPSHFVSFTCFLDTPSTAQSLPKSTPPWSNNTQIRQEYLTDLSFFPSRSHLIKSSITIIHHLTEYWPNWP